MLARNWRTTAIEFAARVRKPLTAATSVGLLALATSACSVGETRPVRAADPHYGLQPISHNSSTRGYVSQRPVEPGDWQEQNRQVAPQQKR